MSVSGFLGTADDCLGHFSALTNKYANNSTGYQQTNLDSIGPERNLYNCFYWYFLV